MLYPLTFRPIFKERIWGGRKLQQLYEKALPPSVPIGESWEISDRPGDVSVIANGPLEGRTLRWLMENHAADLLGTAKPIKGRFPLLIKILDAEEILSVQVHPPAAQAQELGGEPKTELWYVVDAHPMAELYVGLKSETTRAAFERRVDAGTVADCLHRVRVKPGDAMFLPSGRVHAIGGGVVIFEVQQNSDTTYRVFDWNRTDATGKPRDLHRRESLASIDFNDFEPGLVSSACCRIGPVKMCPLLADPLFKINHVEVPAGEPMSLQEDRSHIIAVIKGNLTIEHPVDTVSLRPGQFCLIAANLANAVLKGETTVSFLEISPG